MLLSSFTHKKFLCEQRVKRNPPFVSWNKAHTGPDGRNSRILVGRDAPKSQNVQIHRKLEHLSQKFWIVRKVPKSEKNTWFRAIFPFFPKEDPGGTQKKSGRKIACFPRFPFLYPGKGSLGIRPCPAAPCSLHNLQHAVQVRNQFGPSFIAPNHRFLTPLSRPLFNPLSNQDVVSMGARSNQQVASPRTVGKRTGIILTSFGDTDAVLT